MESVATTRNWQSFRSSFWRFQGETILNSQNNRKLTNFLKISNSIFLKWSLVIQLHHFSINWLALRTCRSIFVYWIHCHLHLRVASNRVLIINRVSADKEFQIACIGAIVVYRSSELFVNSSYDVDWFRFCLIFTRYNSLDNVRTEIYFTY